MALGTNYRRNDSGLWDLVTCYKMAIASHDAEKAKQFRDSAINYKYASVAMKKKAEKNMDLFVKTYK
jgi:hypothetical protein